MPETRNVLMRTWTVAPRALALLALLWTCALQGCRTASFLEHHDDAAREFAYDRQSHIGKVDKAWDEAKAKAKNWIVVSMKSDWKKIFSFERNGK